MNKTLPGYVLFETHLEQDQHILPIGLLALACAQEQEPSILASSLYGMRRLLVATCERVSNPHGLNMSALANCMCGLGMVLSDENAKLLNEEMRVCAEDMGGNFAAFYQASKVGRIPQERQHHVEDFLSAYAHVLFRVMSEWSISRCREALQHTLTSVERMIAQLPEPHSVVRAAELSERLGLPEEMQEVSNRLIQLTSAGLMAYPGGSHRGIETSAHEHGLSRALEIFLTADIYQSAASSNSGRTWGSALMFLVGDGLEHAVVWNALSSSGWLTERGFFGVGSYYPDLERVMAASGNHMPWTTIVEAGPGEDFSSTLFEDTFRKDGHLAPALSEFMPTSESFSHLGRDLDLLRSLIKSDFPMRVLIVGPDGSGRRALLHALAQETGRTKVRLKETSRSANLVAMLSQAQISGYMVQGGLLVLDELLMPDEKDAPAIVGPLREMKRSIHEAWLVNTLENVPEIVVSLFDLVVHVPTMPLAQRTTMAKSLMGDELSGKVAQAATLPGEIASMAQWAQRVGVNDWNALSGCLLGVQRARMAQRKESGQLPVQLYPPGTSKHGFEAVIGEERNVARAQELSEALKSPEAYKKMGITPPKGLLLLGAPGTGKTHLARAMAREAGVNLLLADAAALAETPEAIHAVFNEARKQAPCILFIDEIDAIAAATERRAPDPKRQSILNRLLTELDGFEALDGVLVIGATHRGDLLDAAVTRAGRLGHSIVFKLPEREQREKLWKHYTKSMQVAEGIDWHRVGRSSTGMSPADIAQGSNEAGLRAVRDGCNLIETRHLLSAVEEMLWGEYEDHMPIAQSERWRTAVHESGHAMMGWHHHIEIERACVRPQGQALGFVRWIPEEGRHSQRQGDLAAQLNMLFGGLAAETIVFGAHGTGSGSDLFKIRMTVSSAIRGEGMHGKFPAGVYSLQGEPSPSLARTREAEKIEDELISGAHAQTLTWLRRHEDTLHKLATELMEKRELDGSEIQALLDRELGSSAQADQGQPHLTLVQAARKPATEA